MKAKSIYERFYDGEKFNCLDYPVIRISGIKDGSLLVCYQINWGRVVEIETDLDGCVKTLGKDDKISKIPIVLSKDEECVFS